MLTARPAVLQMKEYHPPLADREGMRLDFNENTSGCSPRVLETLSRITGDQLARYPERGPIERIVADHLGIAHEQLLLTNGVDEAIHLLCESYLEPAHEAIIVVPTFGMYELYVQQTGAKVCAVPAANGFSFPLESVLAAINPRTKLIAFASPNNPTGSIVPQPALEAVLNAAPNAAVLLDEAYFDFYGTTMMPLLARHENLFIARTFSKAYGLAGFRVGVLMGPASQMPILRKISSPYNVNGVALACLQAAIADQGFIRHYGAQVKAGRTRLENALRDLGITFWPSEANFILMRIGEQRIAFIRALRDRGILIRDRNNDPGCEGCVRITIGTGAQMDTLLAILPQCLPQAGGAAQ